MHDGQASTATNDRPITTTYSHGRAVLSGSAVLESLTKVYEIFSVAQKENGSKALIVLQVDETHLGKQKLVRFQNDGELIIAYLISSHLIITWFCH
jgi:outer membrane lipoprotein SlyB